MNQFAFDFTGDSPVAPQQEATPIADVLIARGFAPNEFILRLNRGLTNPDEIPAPSRLFQFPVEYFEPEREGKEGLYLRNPALAELPFVRRVEAETGLKIAYREFDEFGRPFANLSRWWHAVDLMTEKHWRRLLDTRHLTTREDMFNAVSFSAETGRLQIKTARAILATLESPEPTDRSEAKLLGNGIWPAFIPGEKGKGGRWAVNVKPSPETAWMVIHGMEDGWFVRSRCGSLTLGEKIQSARGLAADGGRSERADATKGKTNDHAG